MGRDEIRRGQRVSWKTVHGISSGVIISTVTREKDNYPLGYLVKLDNGKYVIVNSKSFINGSQTAK